MKKRTKSRKQSVRSIKSVMHLVAAALKNAELKASMQEIIQGTLMSSACTFVTFEKNVSGEERYALWLRLSMLAYEEASALRQSNKLTVITPNTRLQ